MLVQRQSRMSAGNWLRRRRATVDHALVAIAVLGIAFAIVAGIWSKV